MQILVWKLGFSKVYEKALKGFVSFTSLVRASSACYLDLLKEILNLILLFQTKESIYHNSDRYFFEVI